MGYGLWVLVVRLRNYDLGFKVQGLGFRVFAIRV